MASLFDHRCLSAPAFAPSFFKPSVRTDLGIFLVRFPPTARPRIRAPPSVSTSRRPRTWRRVSCLVSAQRDLTLSQSWMWARLADLHRTDNAHTHNTSAICNRVHVGFAGSGVGSRGGGKAGRARSRPSIFGRIGSGAKVPSLPCVCPCRLLFSSSTLTRTATDSIQTRVQHTHTLTHTHRQSHIQKMHAEKAEAAQFRHRRPGERRGVCL